MHPHGILFWRLLVPAICLLCCFYNGLCISNMFMVLQFVVFWSYELKILCCYIFGYKNVFYRRMGWVIKLHCAFA